MSEAHRFEYRVVYQREGLNRKLARFATRRAAERRMVLLGPEPWLALGKDPDSSHCRYFNGAECNCEGKTWREFMFAWRKDFPPLLYVRLESRLVGPWSATEPTQTSDELRPAGAI